MATRAEIILEARRWIGTKYVHQHCARGVAVDCVGLIRGVGEATGALQVDPNKYRQFASYSRLPNPRTMGRGLATFLHTVEGDVFPGDICWIAWDEARNLPQHLAILAEHRGAPTLIHADSRMEKVVEHGFAAEWPGLVKSWWRFPGVET